MDTTLWAPAAAVGVVLLITALAVRFMFSGARGTQGAKGSGAANANEGPKFPGGNLLLYFGSQTGTAEGFANTLRDEGRKLGFDAHVVDLEDFDAEQLTSADKAIFLVATHGEGDPTDNAIEFFRWMDERVQEQDSTVLEHVQVATFALGNTQYEHFNAAGRKCHKRLLELGAQEMYALGEGDDDNQLEDDFENWKQELWPSLVKQFQPSGSSASTDSLEVPELLYAVKFLEVNGGKCQARRFSESEVASSAKHFFGYDGVGEVTICENTELRQPSDPGSTKHVEVDLEQSGVSYQTADNAYVLPENSSAVVHSVAAAMGWQLDQPFLIEAKSDEFKHFIPTPCTIRRALTKYVDLTGLPKRSTLHALACFATDDEERKRLIHLSSQSGVEEMHSFIQKSGRSLAELLAVHFTSCKVPLDQFLHLAPRLATRAYTISSSSSVQKKKLAMTVSVVGQEFDDGRTFKGVCTGFLENLPVGAKIDLFVRKSTFRLPHDTQTPIILVGPGTGIAPMRAMLQEREYLRGRGRSLGKSRMYFGCKRRDQDFLYQDLLEGYVRDGVLDELRLAFSREQSQKVYVQHLIKEDADVIWDLIGDQKGYVYVCGATNMGADVLAAIKEIAHAKGGMDGQKFVSEMQSAGRYVAELWSA